MNALSVCIAVNIAADALAGGEGRSPNTLTCLCVWCLEALDPGGELLTRRAPQGLECLTCTDPARARDGVIFVTIPRDHPRPRHGDRTHATQDCSLR